MENYILQKDETILFRGNAQYLPNGKPDERFEELIDVLLTNHNIVLVHKRKKLFKTVTEVGVFGVSDVKIYDETVQIIRRKAIVDVYLNEGELFLNFIKEKYAKEFCDKAQRLISGNSKFVRSVKKTRKAVKETNEALDIDVVDIAKKTAAVACEVAASVGTVSGVGTPTRVIGKVAEAILHIGSKTKAELPSGEGAEKEKPQS